MSAADRNECRLRGPLDRSRFGIKRPRVRSVAWSATLALMLGWWGRARANGAAGRVAAGLPVERRRQRIADGVADGVAAGLPVERRGQRIADGVADGVAAGLPVERRGQRIADGVADGVAAG